MAPQLARVFLDQIGAQQVSSLARAHLSQLGAVEPIAEGSAVCGHLDHDQAPGFAELIARRAEFHQQFLARQRHGQELLEPNPQPLQLPPSHRTLFGDPVQALGKDVELISLRQELDPDTGPRLLPRFVDQMLLQTRQAAFRRAYQVKDRRVGRAHLGQHLLGTPRSISQTRRALPYCRSMRSRNPRKVVLSEVLPGSTS